MKNNWMKAAVMGALLVTGVQAESIRGRQWNQQARIAQGLRSGELTRVETRRIEHQEHALAHKIRRDRIDGGGLTLAERARIDRAQDRLSNQIFRQKHDRQHR